MPLSAQSSSGVTVGIPVTLVLLLLVVALVFFRYKREKTIAAELHAYKVGYFVVAYIYIYWSKYIFYSINTRFQILCIIGTGKNENACSHGEVV